MGKLRCNHKLALLLLLLIKFNAFSQFSTKGNDFFVPIIDLDYTEIIIRTEVLSSVTIEDLFTGIIQNVTIPANSNYAINASSYGLSPLNLDLLSIQKSLHINSDEPISVYYDNSEGGAGGTSIILPQNSLGSNYSLVSDKIEKFISPSKGKKHILRIIKEILTFESTSKKTNIKKALQYFNRVTKKRSICFLLSDFFDSDFFEPVKLSAKRHDLVAVNTLDSRELEIPNVGLLSLQDSEEDNEILVDSSDRKFRRNFKNKQLSRLETLKKELSLCGADYIQLLTQEDIISPLINFFKNRKK